MIAMYVKAKLAQLTIKDWALITSAIGYVLVYALWPSPQNTTRIETVVEYRDREIVKVVEKEVVKFRDRVVNRTVVKPDGTKVTTTITDKQGEKTVVAETNIDKETVVKEVKNVDISATNARRYSLGFQSGPVDIRDFSKGFNYRIDGTFWFNNTFGISVGTSITDFTPTLGVTIGL